MPLKINKIELVQGIPLIKRDGIINRLSLIKSSFSNSKEAFGESKRIGFMIKQCCFMSCNILHSAFPLAFIHSLQTSSTPPI